MVFCFISSNRKFRISAQVRTEQFLNHLDGCEENDSVITINRRNRRWSSACFVLLIFSSKEIEEKRVEYLNFFTFPVTSN